VPSYNILDDVAYDYIQIPKTEDEFDVIAFGTLALRGENNRKVLSQILKSHTFSEVFADVNIRAPFYSKEAIEMCLENATIVKISDEELPIVTEVIFGETFSIEDLMQKISDKYKRIKTIIITKGANGSCCYDCKTGKLFLVDAMTVDVVSTVGAGDSFGAAFLVKYMENKTYTECLEFASKISAFVCSKVEAVPENMQEIIKTAN
jgi:fructokinase